MSRPVYTTAEIRRIEAAAGDARPPLMQRAGEAAARLAARVASERGKDVLVLAGPGNNGGDARIAAERLRAMFFRVTIATSPAEVPPGKRWALAIDGLFGIGLARPVEGDYARLVDTANALDCPRLALDIPSGLASDTGRVLGCALRATHTITFIGLKPGLLTLAGPDHCGELSVADLELDAPALVAPNGWVAEPALFAGALAPRPAEFHKGLAGSLAIVGGAPGMTGAALLAGRAALKLGAGRVYVGLISGEAPQVDLVAPELMLRAPGDALGMGNDALVVGPGLGQSDAAKGLLARALASEARCVLDADALNLIAKDDGLKRACAARKAETIITPHPGEAARLLGCKVSDIQRDRLGAARRLAAEHNAHAVLKGNGSIVAAADGHWFVNTSGNPGMASAGMGDTLSGILGALLAQGHSGETAAVLGTHLHGCAADALAAEGTGPVGLTAGELVEPARRIWNSWLARAARNSVP